MNYKSGCATSSSGGLFFTISSADPVGSAAPEDGSAAQLLICHTQGKSESSSIRRRKPPSVRGHFAQESLLMHRLMSSEMDTLLLRNFKHQTLSVDAQVQTGHPRKHSHGCLFSQ